MSNQAFINGFVKRAMEYGYTEEQAVKIAEDLEAPLPNIPYYSTQTQIMPEIGGEQRSPEEQAERDIARRQIWDQEKSKTLGNRIQQGLGVIRHGASGIFNKLLPSSIVGKNAAAPKISPPIG